MWVKKNELVTPWMRGMGFFYRDEKTWDSNLGRRAKHLQLLRQKPKANLRDWSNVPDDFFDQVVVFVKTWNILEIPGTALVGQKQLELIR